MLCYSGFRSFVVQWLALSGRGKQRQKEAPEDGNCTTQLTRGRRIALVRINKAFSGELKISAAQVCKATDLVFIVGLWLAPTRPSLRPSSWPPLCPRHWLTSYPALDEINVKSPTRGCRHCEGKSCDSPHIWFLHLFFFIFV